MGGPAAGDALDRVMGSRSKAATGAERQSYREAVAYFLDAANAFVTGTGDEREAAE